MIKIKPKINELPMKIGYSAIIVILLMVTISVFIGGSSYGNRNTSFYYVFLFCGFIIFCYFFTIQFPKIILSDNEIIIRIFNPRPLGPLLYIIPRMYKFPFDMTRKIIIGRTGYIKETMRDNNNFQQKFQEITNNGLHREVKLFDENEASITMMQLKYATPFLWLCIFDNENNFKIVPIFDYEEKSNELLALCKKLSEFGIENVMNLS